MPVLFIVVFFKIEIAIIKKKSQLSYLNTNHKPFVYCLIMPALVSADYPYFIKSHLMLKACGLCYQISSGRYTTKEQEDVLEKKWSQCSLRLKWNAKKVKCKADCKKFGKVN